jgi:hypothetical protein
VRIMLCRAGTSERRALVSASGTSYLAISLTYNLVDILMGADVP